MTWEGLVLLWLILALGFVLLEATAVSRKLQRLEYIAKPAVMICLFLWLYSSTRLQDHALWFGLGIAFSLAGDVLLLIPQDRMFLPGLVAFLFTHIFYLIGFRDQLLSPTAWSIAVLFFILLLGIRLLRRIVGALRSRELGHLAAPVVVYGLVISLMLFATMSTLFDPAWQTAAACFASAGGFLFWLSDLMLAWNKFVVPIEGGRVLSILAYEIGQVGIIAGVISHLT